MPSKTFGLLFIALLQLLVSCSGQSNKPGAAAQSNISSGAPKNIASADTSPGWNLTGQKLLLTGTIYLNDGKTPAPNVILYYYQTNTEGKYLHKPGEERSMAPNELGQTHGYIRGWVKSDGAGKYHIYTVRPGAYPSGDFPAHVHVTVKEPNDFKEYYIDDFVFDDDELLTSAYRKKMENRCGSGVTRLIKKDTLAIGERNIILGLNIPGYPVKNVEEVSSGPNIGEDVFSFTPFHAWGPDKGSRACPVCKYGWYHGILYFVGNNPDWTEINKWLLFLEKESIKREKYLKVYFIYGNEDGYSKQAREQELEKTGRQLNLEKVALTFVPSFEDEASEINLNKISRQAANTFILYKRSRVIGRFINLKPTPGNFTRIAAQLDETINDYFYMR